MNKNNILKVSINNQDISTKAYLFTQDNISSTLTTTDYINIEYHKNLNTLYIDFQTANLNPSSLIIEGTNDGNSFNSLDLIDETDGFKRSGFIFIEKNEYKKYRIRLTADSSLLKITGIGSQFCNDNDIRIEAPASLNFIPRGSNTHISAIESSTRFIVQKLNNMSKYKYNGIDISKFNRYDLFNIDEIRQSATYYALHLIYMNVSDSDDNYRYRSDYYLQKFMDSFQVFQGSFLTLDLNDNGIKEDSESKQAIETFRFRR